MEDVDIAIIGAGCCGATTAYRLSELIDSNSLKVVVFDASKKSGGWMNDAKFNMPLESQLNAGIAPEIGLYQKESISPQQWFEHMQYALDLLGKFAPKYESGDPKIQYHPANPDSVSKLESIVRKHGARLTEADIYHLGNEGGRAFTINLYKHLKETAGIDMRTKTRVKKIDLGDKKIITYVDPDSGLIKQVRSRHLVLAPGRDGVDLVHQVVADHNIKANYHPAQLGYRLETKKELYPVTDILYDPKIYLEGNVRTFCTNPGGFVQREKNARTCNGSANRDYKSENTNVALIVSMNSPYKQMNNHDFGTEFINAILKVGQGRLVAQRVGDFMDMAGYEYEDKSENISVRPTMNSRHFVWGDLWTDPSVFVAKRIANALIQLNGIVGEQTVLNPDNILYGPEIKNCLLHVGTDRNYQVMGQPGFYCGGDGVGTSRGINGAMAIGKIIADSISYSFMKMPKP
ncbi:NAD(P)-binding protein [Candidatus Woesearchaeota archaeon]|nr:NAD(P)-binding protein [Candidatus Woesearchaeota archaeon]